MAPTSLAPTTKSLNKTHNNMNNEIIDRLRKVLTLASRGGTQGEMVAAMAKAKEMAMRHDIDLASISLDDPNAKSALAVETKTEAGVKTNSVFYRKHHTWIYNVIREVFHVHTIINVRPQGSRKKYMAIWMVGEVHDVAIAKEILKWLDDYFPKAYRDMLKQGRFQDTALFKNGFYRGLGLGILEANRRQEEKLVKDDANKWAMVVRTKQDAVQAKLAEDFPHLEQGKARSQKLSHMALAAGFEQGRQINLNQMGSAAQQASLN